MQAAVFPQTIHFPPILTSGVPRHAKHDYSSGSQPENLGEWLKYDHGDFGSPGLDFSKDGVMKWEANENHALGSMTPGTSQDVAMNWDTNTKWESKSGHEWGQSEKSSSTWNAKNDNGHVVVNRALTHIECR